MHCNWSKVYLLRSIINFISNCVFPPRCASCGALGEEVCERCIFKIKIFHHTHCPHCGQGSVFPLACPCDARNIPLTSLFTLGPTLRTVLHKIKYQNNPTPLKHTLYNLSHQQIQTLSFLSQRDIQALVPVPLHKTKLKERGYNVPHLFTTLLGELLGHQTLDLLVRTRETSPQAKISDALHREKNIAGAFELVSDSSAKGHLLLVDDVITSGATIEAAAKPLAKAGYGPIWGLSLAQEEW